MSLLHYKHLDELSPRIQRMRMRLMRFSYTISHVPGKGAIKPYYQFSGELTVQQGLLLKGTRLVILTTMSLDILDKLHESQLGITKCRERAKRFVWWPGLSKQFEHIIQNCNVCIKERPNKAEPLILSVLPDRPW